MLTNENIQAVFGNEAAESESIDRLKAYYVKSDIYREAVTGSPLRLIVGHKGIGKSALVKVAMEEDREAGKLPILVRPDDIVGLATGGGSILELIRDWKEGLAKILAEKVFETLGLPTDAPERLAAKRVGNFITWLTDTVKAVSEQLSLTSTKTALLQNFLKDGEITVYVDDLDRGWTGAKDDLHRISALLNAVRDIASDSLGLRFRVALRSDVYFLVRTSDESTDKIEGSVVWHSWSHHEILVVLIKRIESYLGHDFDEKEALQTPQHIIAKRLSPLFDPIFTGRGHWENAPIHRVLMSLIRRRPRDLVKLCTSAAKVAVSKGSPRIGTGHLEAVFEEYSQGRTQDTINEYRSELPQIERLLLSMKPSRKTKVTREAYTFTTGELLQKIDDICQGGKFVFANGQTASRKELAQFLYKINFLCARKVENGKLNWRYFEENQYLSHSFVDFGYHWEIHPAYRWALQPDTISDLFYSIQLQE